MKKIERILSAAWIASKPMSISNSMITISPTGHLNLFLHGNMIASKHLETGNVMWTLAGWNTVTTRSRLRNVVGIDIYTRKFHPYVNGQVLDSWTKWYPLENTIAA